MIYLCLKCNNVFACSKNGKISLCLGPGGFCEFFDYCTARIIIPDDVWIDTICPHCLARLIEKAERRKNAALQAGELRSKKAEAENVTFPFEYSRL